MKADLKEKWVAALRSGDYKQGECALRSTEDRYCCLGVLCNTIDPSKWEVKEGASMYIYGECGSQALSDALKVDIGLTTSEESDLIRMNDSDKKNFKTIADYIEESL